jgi:ABC-type spermidine/putrescine transport system permease subunit II
MRGTLASIRRRDMAAVSPGGRAVMAGQALLLGLLYLFLYFPIGYVAYLPLMENSVWPFPPDWTL